MEVDHIYICTEKKAPAGEKLIDFGLIEGFCNTHPGQGTANRRFYFHNMMLELLWVESLNEVQSERTKPMRLYERCEERKRDISPFGIGFRPTYELDERAPFKSWDYHPIYLPNFLKIQVAEDTELSEPMYFYLSFVKRQDEYEEGKKEPMNHKIPLREVTNIKVYVNQKNDLSEAARIINDLDHISIKLSEENLLELEFDNGVHGKLQDFRPELPLMFRW